MAGLNNQVLGEIDPRALAIPLPREARRMCFSDAAAPQFSMLLTLSGRASEGITLSAI